MGLVNENEQKSLFRRDSDSPQAKATSFMMEQQGGSFSPSFRDNNTLLQSFKIVILSNKLNLLLPFGPLAILLHYYLTDNKSELHHWLNVSDMPQSKQLAYYTGPTVGGLLNATFGNVTELIISIFALKNGMIRVVQLTLLGSILSNMLLVLGCAFFCGGLVFSRKDQVFDKFLSLLLSVNTGECGCEFRIAFDGCYGLLFPAVLHYTHSEIHAGSSELALSRFSSCIMLVAYAAYLFFQLKTQPSPYTPLTEDMNQSEETSDDDEDPEISKWEAIIWLSILTAWVCLLSGYLVDAIEGASVSWKIPISFISVILLPIVGNAAEHAGAIMFAMKDKLDLSLGVAIGSSIQISLFAVPFCVVIGWMMGAQMDLNFQLFETATLFITVIVVAFCIQEGTSNYFKGLMLILCYLIVAASFFVHEDPHQGMALASPGTDPDIREI
ncbi:hypothetical protein DY000_02060674 [Brassica cretica]|uniref:Vacuolar cation/proton exchanger n=1 Tax=Brassica cretica TaxID=69181 RepID=A0ABQ7ANX2_BRACR|nr:hypothetical protein DY000_02060674 [Brassica cretica]